MTRPGTSTRRAYALALTMITLIIVGFLSAMMIERQATVTLAVRRQLDGYQEHHGKKGLAEVVEAYLLMLQNVSLSDLVQQDPHLFDLELADGSIVTVRFQNAQGRALAYPNRLDAAMRPKAERLLAKLAELVEPEALPRLTRADGPLAVDAQSATQPVLLSATRAAIQDDSLADRFTSRLLAMRDERQLTRADLGRVATELDLTTDQRLAVTDLLTVTPTIWGVRVDLRSPRFGNQPERIVSSYEGLVQVGAARSRRTGRGNVFLSFEPIDLAEQVPGGEPGSQTE